MKSQRGSVVLYALVAFLTVILLGTVVTFVGSYFHYASVGARTENLLIAKRDDNKNSLASYSSEMMELVQSFQLSTEAEQKLIKMANESRFGEDGSKAMFQMIKEQNPAANAENLNQMSRAIKAGRASFKTEQSEMLDIKRSFKTLLDEPYAGFFLKLNGYPRVDLNSFNVIINDYTENAYQTGKAEALQLK